jgi:hypothetical protein
MRFGAAVIRLPLGYAHTLSYTMIYGWSTVVKHSQVHYARECTDLSFSLKTVERISVIQKGFDSF